MIKSIDDANDAPCFTPLIDEQTLVANEATISVFIDPTLPNCGNHLVKHEIGLLVETKGGLRVKERLSFELKKDCT